MNCTDGSVTKAIELDKVAQSGLFWKTFQKLVKESKAYPKWMKGWWNIE